MDNHYEHDQQITQHILDEIEDKGFTIPYIESDGYNPRFGYSIGLYKTFNHPELILIGLDVESTSAIINNIQSEIEKGTKFIEGVDYHGFLVDLPIQFVEVRKENYKDYLGYAGWYNGNSINFPALQVVWPDRDGNYPWETNFNEKFRFKQPLLDRNTDFKFLEEKNLGVFTTSEVLEGEPIRFVYHDEDGGWQFHSEVEPDLENAKLVCLEDLVKKDPSLNEIYYLNFGQRAYRSGAGKEWKVIE